MRRQGTETRCPSDAPLVDPSTVLSTSSCFYGIYTLQATNAAAAAAAVCSKNNPAERHVPDAIDESEELDPQVLQCLQTLVASGGGYYLPV